MNHSESEYKKGAITSDEYSCNGWRFVFEKSILSHSMEISKVSERCNLQ